jgi:hypothetical protein
MVSLPNWLKDNEFFAAITNVAHKSNDEFANTKRRKIPGPDSNVDFKTNEEVLIGSRWYSGKHEVHKLMLDIDVDHVYKVSRTPGHGHLILNVNLTRKELETLTEIFAELGITGHGNLRQIQEAEQLFLRW